MNKSASAILFALALGLVCPQYASAVDKPLDASTSLTSMQDAVIIARDVIVQEGDTLASIANRELGRTAFVALLAEYNNLSVNDVLMPGDVIRIPIKVPSRGEFAEVIFVKGVVTATRTLAPAARAILASANSANASAGVAASDLTTEVVTLARNAKIYSGDEITTSADGYASIAFSSGSVINLQPDTVATLQTLACMQSDDSCMVEINTTRGTVTSDVQARELQPVEFRITTPYASAAVRGTVFDVEAAEQLLVGVTEGSVDVAALGQRVPLPTGFGLTVQEGEPPGEPVQLIPAPVFKRVPARIAPGDTVEWWPFADAANYKVILSNDEEANETLQDFQIPANPSTLALQESVIEPVIPGDYFLTVRAIDNNGLMGFTSNTRITVAEIDPDLLPVSTSVVREGSEFLVTVDNELDSALGYEIQISADEAFTDPLSVDVNQTGRAVFRIDQDQVFTRARALIDPFTVSEFGAVTSN